MSLPYDIPTPLDLDVVQLPHGGAGICIAMEGEDELVILLPREHALTLIDALVDCLEIP